MLRYQDKTRAATEWSPSGGAASPLSASVGGGSGALVSCPLDEAFDRRDHMLGSSEHFLGYLRPGLIPGVVDADSPLFESTKERTRLGSSRAPPAWAMTPNCLCVPAWVLGISPMTANASCTGVEGRVVGPRARQVGVALGDEPSDPLDLPLGGLDPLREVTR